jgi:hypothetical protein
MAVTLAGALKIAAKKAGLSEAEYLARRAAGLKRCTGCKEWQAATLFNVDRTRHDGLSAKGRCCSRVAVRVDRKGQPSAFKGRTHTPEARAAMSAIRKGKPGPWKGRKLSLEMRARISAATRERTPKGAACHSYRDGKHAERVGERFTDRYKQWRYDVMLRDRFTCQHCGDARGRNLHAHHIKPFASHPGLRLDPLNGITLCKPCHKAVHAAR